MFTRFDKKDREIQNYTKITLNKKNKSQVNNNDVFNNLKKLCGVQEDMDELNEIDDQAKTLSINEEIIKFKATVANNSRKFGEFWKRYENSLPILSKIIQKYLITPLSSVPSESAFSYANYIQRKKRSSLSANTLKYSILLKNMKKIL